MRYSTVKQFEFQRLIEAFPREMYYPRQPQTYPKRANVILAENTQLDALAVRFAGGNSESSWYFIADQNAAMIVAYKADFSKINSLDIPEF